AFRSSIALAMGSGKEKDTTPTTLSQNFGLLREMCVSVCENNYGKSLEGFLRLEQRLAFALE
ncbi:hypothetical protein, partial [Proteus mirabilis]|uniref:hypothetical protein n=1 Tax=Proteus mirabilis TaxID=584 RepID=UPI0019541F60